LARLVVVSNRVSVPSGAGAKRAGGLEVALRPALHRNGGIWLGWSGKVAPADRLETRSVRHKNVEYVVTDLSKDDFEEYYNGFANRVLWPVLHYRLDLAEFARRDLSGYFRVNDHFAAELEKITRSRRRSQCRLRKDALATMFCVPPSPNTTSSGGSGNSSRP
jgi:trehalose 6-phosphate synthase